MPRYPRSGPPRREGRKAAWRARAAQQAGQPVSPESAARLAVVMTWMDWLRRTEGEEAVKRMSSSFRRGREGIGDFGIVFLAGGERFGKLGR